MRLRFGSEAMKSPSARAGLGALCGVAVAFSVSACGSNGGAGASGMLPSFTPSRSPASPSAEPSPSSTPSPAPAVSATQAISPTPTPVSTHVGLEAGDKGTRVLALQRRLVALGFWISGTDGSYGQTTQQAVMAFQKAAGLERDGVAGPLTLTALAKGVTVTPRTTSGHVIEIDKTKQLVLIVNGGRVSDVINTSTGSNQPYSYDGQTSIATTPSGTFTIFRQVNGDDPGPLGDLWRPKYFNGGIAIHGSPSIPGYPASHGCARMSNAAIDWIWSSGQAPVGTKVVVY